MDIKFDTSQLRLCSRPKAIIYYIYNSIITLPVSPPPLIKSFYKELSLICKSLSNILCLACNKADIKRIFKNDNNNKNIEDNLISAVYNLAISINPCIIISSGQQNYKSRPSILFFLFLTKNSFQ